MLSFLHENENKNDKGQTPQAPMANDNTPEADQEFLMPASTSKSVKQSTIVLAVLFVVGAGVLFFMIKKTVPAEAAAADTTKDMQIETAIAKLSGIRSEMYGKLDQIADKFYQYSNVNQVSVDQLSKNPFIHVDANPADISKLGNVGITRPRPSNGKWRLWSIMSGDQGACCMINNKLLYKGDSVNGMTVSYIGKNAVELTSNDQTLVLRMSQ
jgi:hypothetical protein